MHEDEEQLDEIQAMIFRGPLWDEDEPADGAEEQEAIQASDDDVEAHGGGGFNDAA